jgi:diguanylate cyclase (GGDEF)-like protein/PAS domain S-box-containing protein
VIFFSEPLLANKIIDSANDGITVADMTQPDQPLVFVNHAFEKMTGYEKTDVVGKNCRFLQGDMIDQPKEIELIKTAIQRHDNCRVVLKNYKKNGALFWNELSLAPVLDAAGHLKYYVGIQKDVSLDVMQKERIAFLSEHDDLTGLYNYRGFFIKVPELIERAVKHDLYFGIGIADIDYFKQVNDKHGHMIGNNVLKIVSAGLAEAFTNGDLIARFGGDEFLFGLLLESKDDKFFYKKIQKVIAGTRDVLAKSLHVTLSAGIVIEKATATMQVDKMINFADTVMYTNKQWSRSR